MHALLPDFLDALLSVSTTRARAILASVADPAHPEVTLDALVVDALERVGDGWEHGAYSLAEVYMCGRLCEDLVDDLLPPGRAPVHGHPRIAIATLVDYHALGRRLVRSALRSAGRDVEDYGRLDVPELIDRLLDNDDVDIIMLSVLMLPSALDVAQVRDALNRAGRRITIIVGGAPFRLDRDLWRHVGADAVGYSATKAIGLVRSLPVGGVA
jgi:methylmalonyl-CoA mutase cobalamin-binding domain/chain